MTSFASLIMRMTGHAQNAEHICIYHVPFSGEDTMHVRPNLANDMVKFPPEQAVEVLCSPYQHMEL